MAENKIVCIVQNIQNDSSKGLAHVFKDSIRNEFIEKFLFTQYQDEETGKLIFNTILGKNKKNYLAIHSTNVRLLDEVRSDDKWDIVLVTDSVKIDQYPDCLFTLNTLFMYHNTPNDAAELLQKKLIAKKIKACKEGHHEPNDYHGYKRLWKLFEAWDGDHLDIEKYNRALQYIIEWFGNEKLELILQFLHKCLISKPATLPEIVEEGYIFNLNNKEVSLKDLFENWKGPKDNDGLANLRDGLLAWALVK